MKLQDKIVMLRKKKGWSQEEFAEKMYVSRQTTSRWENGTALPDAQNVLQLSKLFDVTTDYLLNDDYESDGDIPIVQKARQETDDVISKKKMLHLIAAIAFAIASFCSLAGMATSVNGTQTSLSCLSLSICSVNAVAQFVLFLKETITCQYNNFRFVGLPQNLFGTKGRASIAVCSLCCGARKKRKPPCVHDTGRSFFFLQANRRLVSEGTVLNLSPAV